jgi:photosystem II stability/assembly factor-like uncharacterized protein
MKKIIVRLFAFFLIVHCTLNIEHCNAQWVQCNGIGTNQYVYSLTSLGNNIFAGTSDFGVYISTNSGTNWIQTSLNNHYVYSLTTLGNNIIAGSQSATYRSTDNGTSWIETSLNNNYSVFHLTTIGNNIFAGTNGDGIYISTDYGAIWWRASVSGPLIESLASLNNYIFAGMGTSGVSFSTDNGTNWFQTSLNNHVVHSLIVLGNNIFAGTLNDGVFLSTNYGAIWTQTALNNKTVWSFTTQENNIFAGLDYNSPDSGGVYLSTNNGASWLNKNQGFNFIPSVVSLLIVNNYIFAGTNGYSVWRRSLAEIIEIKPISEIVPDRYSLRQNYPNPFNPETKIKFDIPRGSPIRAFGDDNGRGSPTGAFGDDKVVLKVYDILGKEIETLVNEKLQPGTYEVTFNASQYPSGVYFYRLITESFIDTKKMILLK